MYNLEIPEIFNRLGLPKHSDKIFITLEKSGPSSVSVLSKVLKIHRPAIYHALRALIKNDLVADRYFGKRRYYISGSRERIKKLFMNAAHGLTHFEKSAPSISAKNSMGAVRYFEGERGVTVIFNDVVGHSKRGDTFYRYTSEKDLDAVNRLLPADYRRRRDAKRLERLVISNPESGKRKRNRLERFIKHLGSEKESFSQNAIQLIYGDRIAFIDLNTHKAFIIENKTLAEFQKTIFNALYKRL